MSRTSVSQDPTSPGSGHGRSADSYRETVCARCPGTMWGQKSICRVHDRSIGLIEACPEWNKAAEDGRESGGNAEEDGDAALERKVDGDLRDYSWTLREIRRLDELAASLMQETGWVDASLVARYGIEAAMPKGSGRKVGEVTPSERQLERTLRRLSELKARTAALAEAADAIKDERERTLLDCLMAGERINDISRHIGVSRQRLNEIRHSLIRKLARIVYGDEGGREG